MPKSVQEAPWAPLGPQSPSRAKKSCFLGTLWRSQNGTWSLPRTRWRALGRPAASPKPPGGDTRAPKLVKQTAREQKNEIFSKSHFSSALPMRGALRTPPQSPQSIPNRLLGPLGRLGGSTWVTQKRLRCDSGVQKSGQKRKRQDMKVLSSVLPTKKIRVPRILALLYIYIYIYIYNTPAGAKGYACPHGQEHAQGDPLPPC